MEDYREQSVEIALDLGYSSDVIDKIKCASTEPEITRILSDARNSNKRYYKRRRGKYYE